MLKSRCDPALIGVGPCHVHHPRGILGLPLPPCPTHGWKSVDDQQIVTNGCTPGRRVYSGDGIDEWVIGQSLICKICQILHKVIFFLFFVSYFFCQNVRDRLSSHSFHLVLCICIFIQTFWSLEWRSLTAALDFERGYGGKNWGAAVQTQGNHVHIPVI